MRRYIAGRLVILPFQVLAVLLFTFVLSRLTNQSPAYYMAGPYATPETLARVQTELGLDKPVYLQFFIYVSNVLHGNFGVSVITGRPTLLDVTDRLPATLELITISLVLCVLIGLPLGVLTALRSSRIAGGLTTGYGLLAGSFPDFVVGIIVIYVFYTALHVATAPIGRIDPNLVPTKISGSYFLDSILTGNLAALNSSVSHLMLPVLTMLIVYTGGIIKIVRTSVRELRTSRMAFYARACGLTGGMYLRYVLRNALPAIVTITGITYGFLIGAAVLVETVFGWGGVGQYSVQAIAFSDFPALQTFVIFATTFSLLAYLAIDIAQVVINPRLRT